MIKKKFKQGNDIFTSTFEHLVYVTLLWSLCRKVTHSNEEKLYKQAVLSS